MMFSPQLRRLAFSASRVGLPAGLLFASLALGAAAQDESEYRIFPLNNRAKRSSPAREAVLPAPVEALMVRAPETALPAPIELVRIAPEKLRSRVGSELQLRLRVGNLLDLGGDMFLLPNSGSINLEAELISAETGASVQGSDEANLVWETDTGQLLIGDAGRHYYNSWLPPDFSTVSTVRVSYQAKHRKKSGLFSSRVETVSLDASVSFLSPSRPDQFQEGSIDGFLIGEYPDPFDSTIFTRMGAEASRWPKRYPWRYQRPEGFYQIQEAHIGTRISEHIELGLFAMDYQSLRDAWKSTNYPQYVAIDRKLIQKLEDLINLLRRSGIEVTGFKRIYSFRPPAYNHGAIEADGDSTLKVPFSMHQYGRALDMIVDEDNDFVMDDLNGDGRHDIGDATELMKYVNLLDSHYRDIGSDLVGGAGLYEDHDFFELATHTPYVHVDVRGFLGDGDVLIRWPFNWPSSETPIVWKDMYPPNRRGLLAQAMVALP